MDSQWSSQPAQLAQLPTFSPEFSVRLPTLVPSFYQTELPLHQITFRLHLKSPKPLLPDLRMCIGSGAILSSEVMLEIMEEVEHNIEQKKLEEELRTAHRNSQHPIWLSLF